MVHHNGFLIPLNRVTTKLSWDVLSSPIALISGWMGSDVPAEHKPPGETFANPMKGREKQREASSYLSKGGMGVERSLRHQAFPP